MTSSLRDLRDRSAAPDTMIFIYAFEDHPIRKKDFALSAQYLFLFRNFPNLSIIPLTDDIVERAAFLRVHYNLRTLDAVQLAMPFFLAAMPFLQMTISS